MTFDEVLSADCVVVGTGVAGLTTALSMPSLNVLLVTKNDLGGGSTWWAQGGIAASVSSEDSPARHAADTIAVGGGLNDPEAVGALAGHAAEGIAHLRQRGARFDTEPDGDLELGREAGHSVRRIVHAEDATGAEVSRALVSSTRSASHIQLLEHVFVADLVVDGGAVRGLTARRPDGAHLLIRSGAVVLATGGLGRVYLNTTNPAEVTGDGLAMARRAGAAIADAEFVQFHPTALASGRDPMPLLTEALRGEGATLIDDEGTRFMVGEHPDAELAPRDVVARAVWRRLMAGRKVFLDARAAVGGKFPDRFPTVFKEAMDEGIDPRVAPIPAEPAAHYHMGGIAVDLAGRASIPGLWSVGEASRSGVHGANRLASNSLLEGLVFGEAVAVDIVSLGAHAPTKLEAADPGPAPEVDPGQIARLRRLMWEKVGLVRDRAGLVAARRQLAALSGSIPPGASEGRNMIEASAMIATSALARTESRGAHFRSDFPETDPAWDHSLVYP